MTGRVAVNQHDGNESMTAEKYILGELSAAERDQFEEHYFECQECADAVRTLSRLREGVRDGLCSAPRPSLVQGRRWLSILQMNWLHPQTAVALAALSLAAVTGYQYARLRVQLQPQALQSVTLQPTTRGEVPHVSGVSGPFVLLEADLPGASGDVDWAVEAPDGTRILNGTAKAPQPGLLFKILVPSASVPAAQYAFRVRSDSGKEWMFRFRTDTR
jgi:anti-sigma factor RsiW